MGEGWVNGPPKNNFVWKIGSVGKFVAKTREFVGDLPEVHVDLESTVFTSRIVNVRAFSICY